MTFQFTEPLWLLLLAPAVAWVLWLAWTSLVESRPARRRVSLGIRLAAVLAVVLATAGLQWLHRVDGMNVMFVLDVSQSVPAGQQTAAREQVRTFVREKPTVDRAGLVVFGGEAALEAQPSATLEVASSSAVVVPDERTDLAGALRLAMAAMPETGQRRLVVFSDGDENAGDALQTAASAKGLETVVDVVPLGGGRPQDVSVERLQLPSRVQENAPFEVKVVVESSHEAPVTVFLFRNDQPLGTQTLTLTPGRNLLTFPQTLAEAGFYTYDLRLDSPDDGIPQNNRASGFTVVAGRPRILVVSQDPSADASLVDALRDSETGIRVIRPGQFPETLAELQSYECLVASNVAATDLTRDQQRMLQTAVRDFGVGFVCIGGDQAFAAGGYRGTPLDEILPVESDLSSRKVLPSGALVLVIDRSGSMKGEKLDLAKEAAMAAAELLTGHDYIGVVAFDGEPWEVVPMGRAGSTREVTAAIGKIGEGGGTIMAPALDRAHQMLRGVPASLKHVVVLTDGQSVPADFEGMARAMAGERITLSTVALGTDCDLSLLQRMADEGRGRFYHVPRPGMLPQIFLQETAVILKTAISEQPFVPEVVTATEPLRGLGAAFPTLRGHVVTMPRPRAELALATGQGDPLLAHWQYGLGRVVAFTSDARARWAADWIVWDRYRQFWRQVSRWSLRRLDNAEFNAQVAFEQGGGRLVVEALDEQGGFRNFLDLQAAVSSPKGTRESVRLQQTGPGHYETTFPARETGSYLIHLMESEGGRVVASQVVGASLSYSPEFGVRHSNHGLLQRIAGITGGKEIRPDRPGSNPFFDDRRPTWQPQDLWEDLLRFALVLFVLDVGVRRVAVGREELRALAVFLAGWLPRRRERRRVEDETSPSLTALLARRDAVRTVIVRPPETGVRDGATAPMRPDPDTRPRSAPANPPEKGEPSPAEESVGLTSRLLAAKQRAQRGRGGRPPQD